MATMQEAVVGAMAISDGVMFRAPLTVIGIMRRGAMKRFSGVKWWPFVPTIQEVLAQDWGWGQLDMVMAQLLAQAPPAEVQGA
ncbi:MAG: hypothetical protein ACREQ4_03500 [Candidatus Binataceae bacterium]